MKRASVILTDWGVRESFHAIDALQRQTVPRRTYEILWVEYYDHRPEGVARRAAGGRIDKWIVLGEDGMYFKHRLYNEGLLAAEGEIVIVCDSDALFRETFIESVVRTFDEATDRIVLYLDEVRNENPALFPLGDRGWDDVMAAPGLLNWDAGRGRPHGLVSDHDALHQRNYGACVCIRRADAIAAGGFDEHPSYRSFVCGPYELGWRLSNAGFREVWHPDEWLLHPWHPRSVAGRPEVTGPHEKFNHLLALEARRTGRTLPLVENPRVRLLRGGADAPPPPGEPLPAADHEAAGRPPRRRLSGILRAPRVGRILVVAEHERVLDLCEGLDASGLAADVEAFAYDHFFHTLGPAARDDLLATFLRGYRPDLVLYRPAGDQTVEPEPAVLDEARRRGAVVATPDLPRPWIHPAFGRARRPRDIPVAFIGTVQAGGDRARVIDDLAARGIAVRTRLWRMPRLAYAAVLGRVRLALDLPPPGGEGRVRPRTLEIIASGAVPLRPDPIEAGATLAPSDAAVFDGADDLARKVRDLLADERCRAAIVRAALQRARRAHAPAVVWGEFLAPFGVITRGGRAARPRPPRAARDRAWLARRRRVAIWGAGPTGAACAERLRRLGAEPVLFVDNDPGRHGMTLEGLPVLPVAALAEASRGLEAVVFGFQGSTALARCQLREVAPGLRAIDLERR